MRPALFAFLDALAADGDLPDGARRVAIMVALTGAGTSGERCRVDVPTVAYAMDVSERTVWRHVHGLVAGGWLERTDPPRRGRAGGPGEVARYRVVVPGSCATVPLDRGMSDDQADPGSSATTVTDLGARSGSSARVTLTDGMPSPNGPVSHDRGSSDKSGRSSDTTQHDDGTVAASSSASTAAAAALPEAVEILRSRLEAANLVVRWDKLADHQLDRIVDLIHIHGDGDLARGDAALVRAARNHHRVDDPAKFAQAWLPVWESLPRPGRRLAAVTAVCDDHTLPMPCSACRADELAGSDR